MPRASLSRPTVSRRPGSVSDMSESLRQEAPHAPAELLESTGDETVDAVVASLSGLDELPVAGHVAVFEQAHESLRRALADAGEGSVRG